MPATVEEYLSIVQKAHSGTLKLPAFQRKWRWKPKQVRLLFDSLRQGFPIGSFLFIKEAPDVNLAPREFHYAKIGAQDAQSESLVLDGQQRITAGLELFYGNSDIKYFIDLDRMFSLFRDRGGDVNSQSSIDEFLARLETEDEYCIPKKNVKDPSALLIKSHLLWTGTLIDSNELKRCIKQYITAYPDREDFADYVVATNMTPKSAASIPITVIDGSVSAEAITRIFSTLNSTGKMLTPFELVVAVLYPHNIDLADDAEVARLTYPFYGRIDPSGEILLQTIALFSDQETRKAFFPKTITASRYRLHFNDAVKYLDQAGRILTELVGLGLDAASDLLVYPVILPPMAYVLKWMDGQDLSIPERAKAERRLAKWFVGAVLSRRYQQSTHDKQARDKDEIPKWISGSEEDQPAWLKDVGVPNLKKTIPGGALGKLVKALLNTRNLRDPYTTKSVGLGSGKQTSALHHIFPTRFVQNLEGWTKQDSANRVLNLMYCEEGTNGSWLNLDPALQVSQTLTVNHNDIDLVKTYYASHAISDVALSIMRKPHKTKNDFEDFIAERERQIVGLFKDWGFHQLNLQSVDEDFDED